MSPTSFVSLEPPPLPGALWSGFILDLVFSMSSLIYNPAFPRNFSVDVSIEASVTVLLLAHSSSRVQVLPPLPPPATAITKSFISINSSISPSIKGESFIKKVAPPPLEEYGR